MSSRRFVVGVVLIALGALFLGEQVGWLTDPGDIVGRWWPAVVILGALIVVVRDPSRWAGALVAGAVGAVLLIDTTDAAELDSGLVAPLVLMAIGALLLLRPRRRGEKPESTSATPIEPVGHNPTDV